MKHALGGSNKLLSADEAAERLGCTRASLYRNHARWGIPTVQRDGGTDALGRRCGTALRFMERDIEAYMSRNRQAVLLTCQASS